MENEMSLPKLYTFVRVIAQIGVILGCIVGAVQLYGGFVASQYAVTTTIFEDGFIEGMLVILSSLTVMSAGVITIALSFAGLGITYGFLSIVKAQIDSRNAIVKYTLARQES